MQDQELLPIYSAVALVILSCGLALLVPTTYAMIAWRREHNAITNATKAMTFCDWLLVLNFIPREVYNVYLGHLDTQSKWCEVSAVVVIAQLIAEGGAAVLAAFTLYRTMMTAPGSQVTIKQMIVWMAVAWAVGLAFSLYYLLMDEIGGYAGLYCCLKDPGSPQVAVPYFVLAGGTVAAMIHFYRKALTEAAALPKSGATSKAVGKPISVHDILVRRATMIVATFYLCWGFVSINSVLALGGVHIPSWADVVATWLIKFQPLVNCCIQLPTLWKVHFNVAVKAASSRSQSRDTRRRRTPRNFRGPRTESNGSTISSLDLPLMPKSSPSGDAQQHTVIPGAVP